MVEKSIHKHLTRESMNIKFLSSAKSLSPYPFIV